MKRIFKRIEKKILLIPSEINENIKNKVIEKEQPDEIRIVIKSDLNEGKIVTLDNRNIQDVIFLPIEMIKILNLNLQRRKIMLLFFIV